MIEPSTETLIPLNRCNDYIYALTGHRPHLSAIYRWCRVGRNGRRLETIKIGGARYTSREALHRFFLQSPPGSPGGDGGVDHRPDPGQADDQARRLFGLDPDDDGDDAGSGCPVPIAA